MPPTAVLTKMTYTDNKSKIVTLFVSPKYPEADKETGGFAKSIIIPYWLVRDTDDEGAANMETTWVKTDVTTSMGKDAVTTDVLVPAMHNTRVVQAGEELLRFNPKLVKGPEVAPGSATAKKKATDSKGVSPKKKPVKLEA